MGRKNLTIGEETVVFTMRLPSSLADKLDLSTGRLKPVCPKNFSKSELVRFLLGREIDSAEQLYLEHVTNRANNVVG